MLSTPNLALRLVQPGWRYVPELITEEQRDALPSQCDPSEQVKGRQ
jgi:hypothetical protein